MSDVLKMQLDIQNNLEKDIDKSSKAMKGFNSLIENSKEKFGKVADSINKNVLGALRSVRNTLAQIVPLVGTVFSGAIIMDSVRNVLFMDKAITQLSFRMGHGAEGTHALKNAVYDLNAELGIGIENAETLVSELVNLRIPLDMINQMAKSVGMLSEITGVSADQAAELGGNLVRIGRLGQESVDGIFASMVGVQRAVGLTRDEMNSLSSTISNSTQMLNQMGKSAGEIEKYNRGVIKLAAAFASVGVEAGKVLGIMDELLDPGEVEKHAFLLSKLGVSLGDAFEGNIDPQQLISGFRDLGTTLQGMTGPAAAAMAQQLGMSVRDLRQMGELGDDDLAKVANAMADGASASEAMSSAFKDQETPLQRFERAMERIKGFIGEIAEKAMPYIEKGFGWITEKSGELKAIAGRVFTFFAELPNTVKKAIPLLIGGFILLIALLRKRFVAFFAKAPIEALSQGVSEGIKQGTEKGALSMKKSFKSAMREADLVARTEGGAGFKNMMADAELMEMRAKGVGGFFGKVVSKTAQMERNLAHSTRPLAASSEKLKSMGKTIAHNMVLAKNEASEIQGAFATRKQQHMEELSALNTRRRYLMDLKNSEQGLTAEQEAQLTKIKKLRTREMNLILQEKSIEKDLMLFNDRKQRRLLKQQTNDRLIDMGIIEEREKKSAQTQLSNLQEQQEKEKNRMILLESAQEQLKHAVASGKISQAEYVEQYDKLALKIQEQTNLQSKTTAEIEEQEALIAEKEKSITRISDTLKDRGLDISEGAKEIERTVTAFGRAGNILRQAGRNLSASIGQSVDNFTKGAREAASAFAERFKRENIGATLRGAARGAARGVGRGVAAVGRGGLGALGGLMKILGPIALISGVLKNMEPIQELLGKVMERVEGALQRVAEALFPLIESIMESLFPVIEDLIATLLPIILDLVEILIPIVDILLEALMPVLQIMVKGLGELIKFLLPPLLRVLGFLIRTIGYLISGLGRLFPSLRDVGDKMIEAGEMMRDSANNLAAEQRESNRLQRRTHAIEEVKHNNDKILAGLQEELGGVTLQQVATGEASAEQIRTAQDYIKENSDALLKNYKALMRDDMQLEIDVLTENLGRAGWFGRRESFTDSQIEELLQRDDIASAINRLSDMGVEVDVAHLFGGVNITETGEVSSRQQTTQNQINRRLGRLADDALKESAAEMRERLRRGDVSAAAEIQEKIEKRLQELRERANITNTRLEDLPKETARENAANEIRRTWTPTEIRALRDGTVEIMKPMEEVISGVSSFEEQTARASEETAQAQQRQLETAEEELEIAKAQMVEQREINAQLTTVLERIAIGLEKSPNNAAGLNW